MFRKLGQFQSSVEKRETPTLLGTLKTANPNHWSSDKVHKPRDSECLGG
jgi:hypothetical protein